MYSSYNMNIVLCNNIVLCIVHAQYMKSYLYTVYDQLGADIQCSVSLAVECGV